MSPRRCAVVTTAFAGALLLGASACGSGGAAPTSPAHGSPTATATVPGLTSVTPASIPSEPSAATTREAHSPDPAFDYGFVVQITPTGFHPQTLVAACCMPIVWMNLTNRPNSVIFDVEPGGSGAIPAGGSWTFTPPNAEALAYHSGIYPSMTGAVQVNQTND